MIEEGRIATLIHAHAVDLGGGKGGVNLRWNGRAMGWVATVAANKSGTKWHRGVGSSPLRALVALEVAVQRAARKGRK